MDGKSDGCLIVDGKSGVWLIVDGDSFTSSHSAADFYFVYSAFFMFDVFS